MHTRFNSAQCGQQQEHKQRTHCYFCCERFFSRTFIEKDLVYLDTNAYVLNVEHPSNYIKICHIYTSIATFLDINFIINGHRDENDGVGFRVRRWLFVLWCF